MENSFCKTNPRMDDFAALEQGSEAWFAARLGCVTASRVADVVARTKTGYGASRANYMADLICARLTGRKAEGFTNGNQDTAYEIQQRMNLYRAQM